MHVLRCLHFPFPWASPAGLAPSCTVGSIAATAGHLHPLQRRPHLQRPVHSTARSHLAVSGSGSPGLSWVTFACLFSGVLVPRQAGQRGDKGIRLPFPIFFSTTTWNSLSTLVPEEQQTVWLVLAPPPSYHCCP